MVRPKFTMYGLVPHATHDERGQRITPRPYLDTPVTLLEQEASFADFAVQMTNQMTETTGFHFACCQAAVFGIPWGWRRRSPGRCRSRLVRCWRI